MSLPTFESLSHPLFSASFVRVKIPHMEHEPIVVKELMENLIYFAKYIKDDLMSTECIRERIREGWTRTEITLDEARTMGTATFCDECSFNSCAHVYQEITNPALCKKVFVEVGRDDQLLDDHVFNELDNQCVRARKILNAHYSKTEQSVADLFSKRCIISNLDAARKHIVYARNLLYPKIRAILDSKPCRQAEPQPEFSKTENDLEETHRQVAIARERAILVARHQADLEESRGRAAIVSELQPEPKAEPQPEPKAEPQPEPQPEFSWIDRMPQFNNDAQFKYMFTLIHNRLVEHDGNIYVKFGLDFTHDEVVMIKTYFVSAVNDLRICTVTDSGQLRFDADFIAALNF